MSTKENTLPTRKLPVFALLALAFAIFGTGFAFIYLGAFDRPVLAKVTTPGYRLVFVNHLGPYSEVKNIFKEIETKLKEANISPIAASAQYLDDPSTVSEEMLRSKVGYLIKDYEKSPSFLNEEKILPQEVIQATFDGSPVVGSYKSYAAMRQWSIDNHYQLNLPSLEIYYPNGQVVYQLPISLKTN